MNSKPSNFLADFLKMEAVGGILLMAAMVLAIICANSFWLA